MKTETPRQQDKAASLLSQRGMLRLTEFIGEGVTAATVSRMRKKGLLVQRSRGLYQLPDVPLDANHSFAEAAKLVPRGIICLDSALAFHGLTDHLPPRIWMAIGHKEWRPRISNPPIITVPFGPKVWETGFETHLIEHVAVRIYSPAKTVVDMFRWLSRARRFYGGKASFMAAIHGMKETLRLRLATRAEIDYFAIEAGDKKVLEIIHRQLETLDA